MTNEEFTKYVVRRLREYLPPELAEGEIRTEQLVRPNDEQETALYVWTEGARMGYRAFLGRFAEQQRAGRPMEDIMREIADILSRPVESSLAVGLDDMLDFERVRPHLTTKLCDPDNARDYLADKPWVPVGDWAMFFRVKMLHQAGMTGSAVVTNQLMEAWGLDTETLRQAAVAAESANDPAWLSPLMEIVVHGPQIAGANLLDSPSPLALQANDLFALSNRSRFNGACVVGWDGVLDRVGEVLGADFAVVPSSIHEVLIVPDIPPRDMRVAEQSLRDGNADPRIVDRDDILSNRLQFYNRATHALGGWHVRSRR